MAHEMGSEILDPETNESKENYRIVYYTGKTLPENFLNAVRAPFLNTLRYGNDLYKLIDQDAYFVNYSKYFDFLLKRPLLIIKVALLKDDIILGWAMMEHKTLHYIWVKKDARRQGIARSLLPNDFDTISHITHKGINIWVKHFSDVIYNPFA